jgi:hypothetical protein
MSDIVTTTTATGMQPLMRARVDLRIRPGTLADVAFMDSLQKQTTKQVGWMPTKALEGKIKLGQVIVAWASRPCASNESQDMGETPMLRAVGYLIGQDQYFKRDDVGIIYQMNVMPEYRRSLVAAMLLKAQFERSAYGCKLYCCWCAQDIEANKFWEAMGFVALAFRSGSEKKSRTHIFWQKRIRAGDEATPWWFPSQTSGGSIREDRIVLPIPPGTHWSDAKPMVMPSEDCGMPNEVGGLKELEGEKPARKRNTTSVSAAANPKSARRNPQSPPPRPVLRGFSFAAPKPAEPAAIATPLEKPKRTPKPKRKNDPQLVAAARELRDRWLDEVNAGRFLPGATARYDVTRQIAISPTPLTAAPALLLAAA